MILNRSPPPSLAFWTTVNCGRRFEARGSIARGNSGGTRPRAICGAPTKTLSPLMRIGIDGRELCGKPTGVGRHLAGLLGAWSTSPNLQRHAFFIYSHQTPAVSVPSNAALRVLGGSGGTLWEQTTLLAAARAD